MIYSIDNSVDTWLKLYRHLGRQSVESQLTFNQFILVSWQSADYQPTVNQVSMECRPRINQDIEVLIDVEVLIEMMIEGINQEHMIPNNMVSVIQTVDSCCSADSLFWCEAATWFFMRPLHVYCFSFMVHSKAWTYSNTGKGLKPSFIKVECKVCHVLDKIKMICHECN